MCSAGWLHRIHHGVYAVGHRALSKEGDWMAAVLACGIGAAISHAHAAALWSIRPDPGRGPIDVTLRTRAGRKRRAGIRVHRPRVLRDEEFSTRRGIPCTTPARTILDLAGVVHGRPLERAIDEGARLRLLDMDDLVEILEHHRGHPGARRLRGVLARHEIGSTLTRSELEERFLRLCRQEQFPAPLVNAPLLGYVVDFLWPGEMVIVELDGHQSHGTRAAFESDRDRDSSLLAAGYLVLRFTWRDVTRRPAVVVDRVRRVLRARTPTGGATHR
jgi:very-short-patch-repair endonuclease